MKKSEMLDYCKVILEKVSFDSQLFYKELKKAINWLCENEITELENWARHRFSNQMQTVKVPLIQLKA